MQIKQIDIRNFRRNRKLTLRLQEITTIRGRSAAGKSSLIGAIKWVVLNTPHSNRFISWGSSFAAVRLTLEDGTQIIRKRSSRENYYKLIRNGHVQKFEAMGYDVPPEIRQVLHIDEINFRGQHQGFFWFSLSPSDVSRELNKIAHLEDFDKASVAAGKVLREMQYAIQESNRRAEETEQEIEQTRFVVQADSELRKIESADQNRQKIAQQARRAVKMVRDARLYRVRSKNASCEATDAFLAVSTGRKYQQIVGRRRKLENLCKNAYHNQNIMQEEPVQAAEALSAGRVYKQTSQKLSTLLRAVKSAQQLLQTQRDLYLQIEQDEKRLLHRMGQRCPLCGSKLEKRQ